MAEMRKHIKNVKGVLDIHHIHVWSIDGVHNFATLHIKVKKYDAKITQIFTPNIHINMIYDVIQPNSKTNVDIAGIPYQIKGDNLNPFGIESGITFNLNKDNWDLSAGYDLEIRSDFISHTGHIRAKYSF